MDWNGKRVLVTGAGGFIGSHLVEALVSRGADVRAFVRYNSVGSRGHLDLIAPSMLESIETMAGDLRDQDAVSKATEGVDTVFHLGALIAIPYSYLHPREVVETNVLGTLNVLTAGRDCGVRRVVHTSTSEVYGSARRVPIDETHPLQGQSPYSASKIAADKLAESFYCAYGLPVTTVRPFNTYGPRQSARAVIPTIITQALTSNEVHLGSLSPTRDFTFVTDTVAGFLLFAESERCLGATANLGVGKSISIGELAALVFKVLGREPRIISEDARKRPERSEVDRLHSDNALAFELAGWIPRVGLEEGLEATADWIGRNLHLFSPGDYSV